MAFKVLVLDDSPTSLRMTRHLLEQGGFEVITLDTATLFFKVLNRDKPDIALVDVGMPVVDGGSVVEMARRTKGHICPILLYSERDDAELKQLVARYGANGYVRKSSDANALKTAILGALL
jgi:DNA-binding response OmpR family regulator